VRGCSRSRCPESDIWLGARASEHAIKRLSDVGELATYRIVHFATHGALAGELTSGAEPGLILTPPREATADDDGYLSASEIASLKLDADWVILSACNTAAGGSDGAEPLSGLARAFFYAGARALLVSHWAVDSDSTVKLIKTAISSMSTDKTVGRSEALRRSMLAMIQRGKPHEAHPAYWAPFVVVGQGAAEETPLSTSSIVAAPRAQTPTKSRIRPAKKAPSSDWRKEIWR
jgi:CHAT domain-containing protein